VLTERHRHKHREHGSRSSGKPAPTARGQVMAAEAPPPDAPLAAPPAACPAAGEVAGGVAEIALPDRAAVTNSGAGAAAHAARQASWLSQSPGARHSLAGDGSCWGDSRVGAAAGRSASGSGKGPAMGGEPVGLVAGDQQEVGDDGDELLIPSTGPRSPSILISLE
jgi:hypothetical protein